MRVPYAIGSVNISQSPIDPKAWHILVGVPEELGRQGLPEIYRKVPVRYVALGSSRSFE